MLFAMIPKPRPRLLIPAALAVASIAGCPAGDDSDDTGAGTTSGSASADSSASATEDPSTDPTTEPSTGATDPSTGPSTDPTGVTSDDGSSSAADSGSDTGDLPTCTDLPDEPTCQTESQCIWLPELGGCIRNCEMITDLSVCMASPGCVVYEDVCGYQPIA